MRWVKCRNPIEWVCDVCGRSGDEVDSIFHINEYSKNTHLRALDWYTGKLGNIAVCCDCENHRERLLKELDIEGVDE
ncbi:hypothetical protein OAQ45_01870 [Candidatus Marinimicrobia bacterium]|jgi:hypothetical protein|nr:hypothetical protein [Candidatus Neomarinimicrobiota bacterium]